MVAAFLGRMARREDRDAAGAPRMIFSRASAATAPDDLCPDALSVAPEAPDEAEAATPDAWAAALGGSVAEADVSFLAAGEYHENWLVRAPAGPVVLRINRGGPVGSQLGLADQISYECRVLHALAHSGATPRPLALAPLPRAPAGTWTNARGGEAHVRHPPAETPPGGTLLMQWLPGRPLDYRADIRHAARVFAAVHAVPAPPATVVPPPGPRPHALPPGVLVAQPDPVAAIAAESSALLDRHAGHPLAPRMAFARDALLTCRDRVVRLAEDTRSLFATELPVIANTEVNSGNFLAPGGENADAPGGPAAPCGAWLVDWEKAVVTSRYQDLGHFLSPTTTLWKTDFTFDAASRAAFLGAYRTALDAAGQPAPGAEECAAKTEVMMRAVLLRGLSWCLMAWHEYAGGGRALTHADTFRTIERYLENIAWFLR